MDQKQEQLQKNAALILTYSRRKLIQALPELLPVLSLLREKPLEAGVTLFTDGQYLYYDPQCVVEAYLHNKNEVMQQMLHILLHGLLGHFSLRGRTDDGLFDAAADLKVAELLVGLSDSRLTGLKKCSPDTAQLLRLGNSGGLLPLCARQDTPEKRESFLRAAEPFRRDSHEAWNLSGVGDGQTEMSVSWRHAARVVAAGITARGGDRWGNTAGALSAAVNGVERSTVSFRTLLQAYMENRERMEIDPESFDPSYYRLVIELNGAPFVEPNEFREGRVPPRLIVALDTSGSCQGETMRRLLGELLSLLCDLGGSARPVTLLQCDTKIQKVMELTREDSVAAIASGFSVFGLGGTDFCPVFDWIETQRNANGMEKPNALLYLTDGFGAYPKNAPDYPVVFIMEQENGDAAFSCLFAPDWITQAQITADGELLVRKGEQI